MKLEETFSHFLLQHQLENKRTLNFLILMEAILTSAHYLQHYYNLGALHGVIGESGEINIQGEKVMELDQIANRVVTHYLKQSKQVIHAISEEVPDIIELNAEGRYFVYFDPLDGSSNVKHSLPVGFLFGIGKRNLKGEEDCHVRSGAEFIAAGMFLIPTGIFTFALKKSGTWNFLRDESGVYIRPAKIILPEESKNWELSFNSSNRSRFSEKIAKWIDTNESKYNFRYCGSLAVDFHRLLHNGGLFMYPAIVNHKDAKKNYPNGKLRLLYECAVVAFMAQQAGGLAINEQGDSILDLKPQEIHARSTLFVGNKSLIEELRKSL